MSNDDRQTPARRQYLAMKQRHPDALLLFRMGDFYEMFDDDAVVAARDLHITLTSREFGKGNRVPMAGVPHHALHSYLRRLLAKGHRVAISEQLSEPGHGLVERDVVRVVTPGTVAELNLLTPKENNYLVALVPGREGTGLARVDVTTGEFVVMQFGPTEGAALAAELARIDPAECLVPEGKAPEQLPACPVTPCPPRWFAETGARERLLEHFNVASLEAFGCDGLRLATGAAGAALAYIESTNRDLARMARGPRTEWPGTAMTIDPSTRRNLDLTRAARGGGRTGTLLHVLDQTETPMGGRLLRRWLSAPLLDPAAINGRLDVVEALLRDPTRREAAVERLRTAGDLERTAARARQGTATARDLLALVAGLRAAGALRRLLRESDAAALHGLAERLDPATAVADLVDRAVCIEGERVIRRGFHAELDAMTTVIADAQGALLALERRLRERTGIRSLKVNYNKVFGYYIEVTKANLGNVPGDFVRRQTLANAERFITTELRDLEAAILRAEEGVATLEASVFAEVRDAAGAAAETLLNTAAALAELDVLAAFARVTAERGYVRPVVDHSGVLAIEGGRHPVVEASLEEGAFIANDTDLRLEGTRLLLITGPNMAGKSTYLRQVALIALMAQAGCFVPATSARVGVVDRIFTRVGAHDDLAAGASTFLVEMVETAAILRHATPRSLVILDEIGRGTSTRDGLAIAQAVVEDVHDRLGARTLFATHYHELTALAARLPGLENANAAVVEEDGRVAFLHRIRPGGADRSYGIHVAAIAGLPEHVLDRARTLLEELEAEPAPVAAAPAPTPLPIRIDAPVDDGTLAAQLRSLDLARMTPLDALNTLAALQERAGAAAVEGSPRLRRVAESPAAYDGTRPEGGRPWGM